MSSRIIVSLGVCMLLMVLLGAMTVEGTLGFYVVLTLFFALVIGALMVITRSRAEP